MYSQITNLRDESKELCFTIELSEDAFVSNLCMEVDGVKYRGIVEEKERARDEYDQAENLKSQLLSWKLLSKLLIIYSLFLTKIYYVLEV